MLIKLTRSATNNVVWVNPEDVARVATHTTYFEPQQTVVTMRDGETLEVREAPEVVAIRVNNACGNDAHKP